jgi:xanthine dehydrogenase accessory factor
MRWNHSGLCGTVVIDLIRNQLETERLGAVLTVVAGEHLGAKSVVDFETGFLGGSLAVSEDMLGDALSLMEREQNRTLDYGASEVFIETLAPRPHLLIFGAVHIAQELTKIASLLGFRVVVSDARAAFTTVERFPDAAEIFVGWPDELADRIVIDRRTYVVLLSHDARFEDPVLPMVLNSSAKYIGAMGSRRTHSKRLERLAKAGFTHEQTTRVHGPVGLDIGAETPAETAVAILGEMIQVRYGSGSGLSLVGRDGRIHLQRTEDAGDA